VNPGNYPPRLDDDDAGLGTEQWRLLPLLASFLRRRILSHFEWIFVAVAFAGIVLILWLIDQKLAFLNFYFIPVLLAGYFLNARSAVLGSVLSILVVTFFVVIDPDAFYQKFSRMGLYLHLVSWGSFLILAGALVGHVTGELRSRFFKANETLSRLGLLHDSLRSDYKRLEERNLNLEAEKTRSEAVLNAVIDPRVAQLIVSQRARSENRPVSVLCAEIVSPGAEAVSPETEASEVNRLFSALEPILLYYHGHLERYSGYGFLAEFGVPFPLKPHSLLAALSSRLMHHRSPIGRRARRLRIGLAAGPCLIALLGSEKRRNYTVAGPPVDRARRLCALSPPGGIVADAAVASAVSRWFSLKPVEAAARAEAPRPEAGPCVALGAGAQEGPFELLGLRDPVADRSRVPAKAADLFREHSIRLALPLDTITLLEAMEGSLGRSSVAAALAAALADAVGLDERSVRAVLQAAWMQDVGKRNLPGDLLELEDVPAHSNCSDSLPLREHPLEAERVIARLGIPVTPEVIEIIREHHERSDGSGYPRGLSGEEISLGARILAISSDYARVTGWWGERPPMPGPQAVSFLQAGLSCGRYDRKLGEVFLKLLA
jgi:class 3 adenylate cyclase